MRLPHFRNPESIRIKMSCDCRITKRRNLERRFAAVAKCKPYATPDVRLVNNIWCSLKITDG